MPRRKQSVQLQPFIESERIVLNFSGGMSHAGTLELGDYAQCLQGWNSYFKIAADIYALAIREANGTASEPTIDIRIAAEAPGSFQVLIDFILHEAGGELIKTGTSTALKWTTKQLMEWYKALFEAYKTAKRDDPNINKIIAALEEMTASRSIALQKNSSESELTEAEAQQGESERIFNKKRLLVEEIDDSLRDATILLDHNCQLIQIINAAGTVVISISDDDRVFILAPLSLPPPTDDWQQLTVTFERINVKTGRALIYLENDAQFAASASHARIVDKAIDKPRNVYTDALNEQMPIQLWGRRVRAERGRLNLMWHITAEKPRQGSLFGPNAFFDD